jgi:hypothetical protein
LYDLDTSDWKGDYAASKDIFQASFHGASPASKSFIALAHDVHERTVNELLPFMLDTLKRAGFTSTTMGECLGDDEENWYRDPLTGGPPVKQAIVPSSPAPEKAAGSEISGSSSSSSSSTSSTSSSSATATLSSTRGDFGTRSSGTPALAANASSSITSPKNGDKSGPQAEFKNNAKSNAKEAKSDAIQLLPSILVQAQLLGSWFVVAIVFVVAL